MLGMSDNQTLEAAHEMRNPRFADEKNRVLQTVRATLEKNPSIRFAYVFGSFVTQDHYKDIDIGIFLGGETADSPLKLELSLESEIQEAVRVPADVRSLNNSPLGFVYNVLKSGVLLLDRDEAVRVDFEGLTYKRYFDFQHLRKQYLREIINAPV
jgi:predicted nucleotidyltransferase